MKRATDGGGENGEHKRGRLGAAEDRLPTNPLVSPMLTDLYQLTMAYGHWKAGRHEDPAAFDLYFRKNPFRGAFTLFAGLDEVLRLLAGFRFAPDDLSYLKEQLGCEDAFLAWLANIDGRRIKVWAIDEGSVVFPRVPLLRVEGPLAIAQLLETTMLNLVNYASLVATNAARMRIVAGPSKVLMEFGLRRAQGPDGALSASRYSYVGGFDATSNVLAGKLTGIPIKGTHAHAYVQAYRGLDDLKSQALGSNATFVADVVATREALGFARANDGELAAFISYAQAFPNGFLALVDTYDTLSSGVPNFIAVAIELLKLGLPPTGIRLDSGDLSYFSKRSRKLLQDAAAETGRPALASVSIVASNDINEAVLQSLNAEGHEIDAFGIGTHLVTCQAQPALGCVFKLVEINGEPRIKLSQDMAKVSLPGAKQAYRLFGAEGHPLVDLLMLSSEPAPEVGVRILCRHPFEGPKRVYVTPARVEPLLQLVWDGGLSQGGSSAADGDANGGDKTAGAGSARGIGHLGKVRAHALHQISVLREDHLREVNPTPYKVSVSETLYTYMHQLWQKEAPITELS